jgi:hypothetical protein
LGAVVPLYLAFYPGMGVDGEYSAINLAIDELIPAKYRARVDIAERLTSVKPAANRSVGGAKAFQWRYGLIKTPSDSGSSKPEIVLVTAFVFVSITEIVLLPTFVT